MDVVKNTPGCCVNDVCQHFDTSRVSVMKHLNVLVDAQLILSKKVGRTRQLFFNAAPIQMIYDRWTTEYAAFWATQVVDLKYKVEKRARKKRKSEKANSTTGKDGSAKSARKKAKVKK